MKNGVPFDVAFSLSAAERMAFVLALGRLAGGEFDFNAMQWRERTA